jgi:hypothetical protein
VGYYEKQNTIHQNTIQSVRLIEVIHHLIIISCQITNQTQPNSANPTTTLVTLSFRYFLLGIEYFNAHASIYFTILPNTAQIPFLGLTIIFFAATADSTAHQERAPPSPTTSCPAGPMTMSKPTIVNFAGAFHQKEHLKLINPILEAKGYTVISQTLRTVNHSDLGL